MGCSHLGFVRWDGFFVVDLRFFVTFLGFTLILTFLGFLNLAPPTVKVAGVVEDIIKASNFVCNIHSYSIVRL